MTQRPQKRGKESETLGFEDDMHAGLKSGKMIADHALLEKWQIDNLWMHRGALTTETKAGLLTSTARAAISLYIAAIFLFYIPQS